VKIFLVIIVLFYAHPLWAWNPLPASDDVQLETAAIPHTLSPVVVHATSIESGETTIGGVELDILPSATGSITEALKGMSHIQYDYERQSSLTVGEIAPPRISISGAKPYENNFMIDGMSVTNTINPSGFDQSAGWNSLNVGGGDAGIFYDTDLIESITVHSSNVPAQYGGFVGGAVDAQLREPATDRWRFSLSGRYTNDSMFDLRDDDKESDNADNQPRFSIYSGSLSAEGPLNQWSSLLLVYSRRHSVIPLKREDSAGVIADDDQKRTSENFHGRLMLTPANEIKILFDVTYAPYEELRWISGTAASEWKNVNDSWRFANQVGLGFTLGEFVIKTAYVENGFSRDSSTNYYESLGDNINPEINYRKGGVGDATIKNREFNASLTFLSENFRKGSLLWSFVSGLDYGYKHTDAWNQSAVNKRINIRNNNTTTAVLSYDEVNQSSHIGTIGGHFQTDLIWHRLLLRPGLRVDYDNFSANTDVAPRFKTELDTFGNGVFRLVAGVNRYYSSQLRAYAFDRWRPINSVTTEPDGTVKENFGKERVYSIDELDTPYSDELSAGFVGSYSIFNYSVELLQRKHKKQLDSRREDNLFYMTNDGRSRYEAINLSLSARVEKKGFGSHLIAVGATKSRTKSTFAGDGYDADTNATNLRYSHKMVFYDDAYMARSELPAANYSAPWVLTLSTRSSFVQDHVRLYTLTRWRDSSKGLAFDNRRSDETRYGVASGSQSSLWFADEENTIIVRAYKSGKISGGATTDITTEFDAIKTDRYHLTLILEVLNMFNGNMQTGIGGDAIGTGDIHGRGFYLGARMSF